MITLIEHIPLSEFMATYSNPLEWKLNKQKRTAGYYQCLLGDDLKVISHDDLRDAFKLSVLMTEYKYLTAPNHLLFPKERISQLKAEIEGKLPKLLTDFRGKLIVEYLKSKYQSVSSLIEKSSSKSKCTPAASLEKVIFVITCFPEYKFLRRYKRHVPNGVNRLQEIETMLSAKFPAKSKIGRWLV